MAFCAYKNNQMNAFGCFVWSHDFIYQSFIIHSIIIISFNHESNSLIYFPFSFLISYYVLVLVTIQPPSYWFLCVKCVDLFFSILNMCVLVLLPLLCPCPFALFAIIGWLCARPNFWTQKNNLTTRRILFGFDTTICYLLDADIKIIRKLYHIFQWTTNNEKKN